MAPLEPAVLSSVPGPPSGPVVVSVHGCLSEADLGLALGSALGVQPVGAAGALRSALAEGRLSLVVRGAAQPALAPLHALLEGVDWELRGEAAPGARLAQDVDPEGVLAGFPAGLPGPPVPGGLEVLPGRVAVPASGPTTSTSRAHAREVLAAVLRVGEGGGCPEGLRWPDLLALDILARESHQERDRVVAAAASARLRVRWGQAAVAVQRLEALGTLALDPEAAGLVDRAAAVVALHLGHRQRWRRAIAAAEHRATRVGPEAVAAVAMEKGAALLEWWDEPGAAAAEFARAQLHWDDVGHLPGRAEALCGEGWALLAQGLEAQARVRVGEAQRLVVEAPGAAALALALGLSTDGSSSARAPEHGAPLALVRARRSLKAGKLEHARVHADRALADARAICHAPGLAAAQRLLGDVAVVEGRVAAADAWFRAALATQAAVHSRSGVEATVQHALRCLTGAPRIDWQRLGQRLFDRG